MNIEDNILRGLLLYLKNYQHENKLFGTFHYSSIFNRKAYIETENNCKVEFIDIIENGSIRYEKDISEEILQKLMMD